MLDRQALESKLLQQLLAHPELDLKIWSDAELLQSIRATLQQQSSLELWIFAYGSLIWNPLFNYCDRRPVIIQNWQRKFCILAHVGRGTVDNPGLVLGLESKKGSCCQGIAYRLPVDENLESELLLLWHREMAVGAYIPTWIEGQDICTNDELSAPKIEVLAFMANPQHPVYVNWSDSQIVESLATAEGDFGSSAAYLNSTVEGLLTAGIEDQTLIELNRLVQDKQKQIRCK
ncbi:MAG: gamma-glutamylcyclotransferase [Cyanobacteria bacterium P01_C01_bin.72]